MGRIKLPKDIVSPGDRILVIPAGRRIVLIKIPRNLSFSHEERFNRRKKRALAEPHAIEEVGMELTYRNEKMEDKLLEDLAAMVVLPNVKYVPLTPDISIVSVYLRKTLGLTFFDSHHAATTLSLDGRII